jgi:hypothetical protein
VVAPPKAGYRHTFPAGAVGFVSEPVQAASSSAATLLGPKLTVASVRAVGAGSGKVTASRPTTVAALSVMANPPRTVTPEGIVPPKRNTPAPGAIEGLG